jgi:hypothetical protein
MILGFIGGQYFILNVLCSLWETYVGNVTQGLVNIYHVI